MRAQCPVAAGVAYVMYESRSSYDGYVCVAVLGHVHMSAGALGGQKRALELLELEEQAVVNLILGTKFRSSSRVRLSLKCWAISPLI